MKAISEKSLVPEYIEGCDPITDELSVSVLQIFNKKGELIITKFSPKVWINPFTTKSEILKCSEIIERYKDLLTLKLNKLMERSYSTSQEKLELYIKLNEMKDNLKIDLKDDKDNTSSHWINFQDWQRLKVWKSYKELMFLNHAKRFGIYNDHNKIEEEQFIKEFNKFYKKEYPENYKLLNLEGNDNK